MIVKIKRIDKSLPLPRYETQGAVAFDFIARESVLIEPKSVARIPSNVVVEVPDGYMLYIKDRSSTAKKKGILITAGVVDQDYCGDNDEILMQFFNPSDSAVSIEKGDRLAQGIFVRVDKAEWSEVEAMEKSDRGGFGTTGSGILDQKNKPLDSAMAPAKQDVQKNSSKGKLIVIDGPDGSGKGTQTDLLIQRMRTEGYVCSKIDFPQYGEKSAGLIENYLNGRYGDPHALNPYIASFFYTMDRYDASFEFKKLLDQGEIVISNRYVSSNMGHQGCKFNSKEARKKYFEWLDTYEHGVFKIPRPDLTIILHVPPEYARELLDKKDQRLYIEKGKKDMLEKNVVHQNRAEQTYLEMCEMFPNYELIECVKDGELLSVSEVSDLVWERVKKVM